MYMYNDKCMYIILTPSFCTLLKWLSISLKDIECPVQMNVEPFACIFFEIYIKLFIMIQIKNKENISCHFVVNVN